MQDKIVLQNISEEVEQLCRQNNIKKVIKLIIIVNYENYVDENIIYEYLKNRNKSLIGPWTNIELEQDDILEQRVILQSIQGENDGE
jgi:hypothetical protein